MSSNESAIRVEDLSKCYSIYTQPQDRLKQSLYPRLQRVLRTPVKNYFHEFWALRHVSFEVKKGETIGIIGRNGSGKSTLLQLICGTLTPTSGTVQTAGRIAALLELGSGFNPEFTGHENVYLNGAVLGLSQEELNARYDDIVAFADIGDFIERPVKTYSSGMVVRLAFAVQAMVAPDILIVDEALAVGDEKFQRKCFARLEELKSMGTAILFVSHSGPQVVELCDKALLLERGERLMFTTPLIAVRAYQKLIYAPANEQTQLTNEYRLLDLGQALPSLDNSAPEAPSTLGIEMGDASFDPGLIPETTENYPEQGATIDSFQIMNMAGQRANVLSPGHEYQFQITGRFSANNDKIYFGIHIRSVSGAIITGQRYPEEGKFLEQAVYAGETFRITYHFKMSLVPGVYFVGGGVWSLNEPNCLHRILDAAMFRVTSGQQSNSFGYVDIASKEPALYINSAPTFTKV